MAKMEISVVINRPLEEVFAFLSNSENESKWSSGGREVKKTSQGPIGVGTTYRTTLTFLGQRLEGEVEFTEYEPNRSYATKINSGPFPVKNQLTFERVGGGTQVNFTSEYQPGGFFKLAEPLLASMVKRQFEADLANLKDLMEANVL